LDLPLESLHDAIPDPEGSEQLNVVATDCPRAYVPPDAGDVIVAVGGVGAACAPSALAPSRAPAHKSMEAITFRITIPPLGSMEVVAVPRGKPKPNTPR